MYCNAVRQKVKDIIDLIQDDDRLREERKKAKKNKDKYTGVEGGNRYGGGSSYRYSKSLVYFLVVVRNGVLHVLCGAM